MTALVWGAWVHAHLTVLASVGEFTHTLVGVHQVNASSTIPAGTTLAVVNVYLAVAAGVARGT